MDFIRTNAEIIAILLSPLVAWYITILYQNRKEKRNLKFQLFLDLMANRKKSPVSPDWCDALNRIDVVFQNNKKVRQAWREYYDTLASPAGTHRFDNQNSYMLDLLSEIANALGYRHLKQTEIDRFYVPQIHLDNANISSALSRELLRVVANSKNFSEPVDNNQNQ